MRYFISPSYQYDKLESPIFSDLIDIFEDAIRNWIFVPVLHLLKLPHGEVAAVALLSGYFESIEIYCTGEESKGQSRSFFANGFARVFAVSKESSELQRLIADAVYAQVRCGFAHDGLFRNRVFFSRDNMSAMVVTWPKKDGVYDKSGNVESIVINPDRFYECVLIHFDRYIEELRFGVDMKIKDAFQRAIAFKWALNEGERLIAVTEDAFRKL